MHLMIKISSKSQQGLFQCFYIHVGRYCFTKISGLVSVSVCPMVLMSFYYMLQYQADEPVTLWVNKVGPYNNPQETYNYYSLPFCHPGDGGHKWGGLGEVLGGNELIDSRIDIKFKSMSFFKRKLTTNLLFLKGHLFLPCSILFQQEMWRKAQSANLYWMQQKWHNLRMLSKVHIGLNFSWVYFILTHPSMVFYILLHMATRCNLLIY